MNEVERVIKILQDSRIENIVLVDDAFNPPAFPEGEAGSIITYLQSEGFLALIQDDAELFPQHEEAIDAINRTEYDDAILSEFWERLYNRFCQTLNRGYDPAGYFGSLPGLKELIPLIQLLRSAKKAVKLYGAAVPMEEIFGNGVVHLVFMDYLFHSGNDNDAQARAKSLDYLAKIVAEREDEPPAVILMSSKDISSNAQEYREALSVKSGKIVAARFRFLHKVKLSLDSAGVVHASVEAIDPLLDIFETYEFSKTLQKTLHLWRNKITDAADATKKLASDLELRDFAYLVRFRLHGEGQHLFEYLEWLLGELLRDELGRRLYSETEAVDGLYDSFTYEDSALGVHEGTSATIAHIYNRVRIEAPRAFLAKKVIALQQLIVSEPLSHRRVFVTEFRTGDLFYDAHNSQVLAILTPECDLVRRGASGEKAKRMTMIRGDLKPFDADHPSLETFIEIRGTYRTVKWDFKDIITHSFDEFRAKKAAGDLEHIGTLKPIFAQQLLRRFLDDFGRVGVLIGPAIPQEASFDAYYRNRNGKKAALRVDGDRRCVIVPSLGGTADKPAHTVLLQRKQLRAIREAILQLEDKNLEPDKLKFLNSVRAGENLDDFFKAAEGVHMGKTLTYGIEVRHIANSSAWVYIVVKQKPPSDTSETHAPGS